MLEPLIKDAYEQVRRYQAVVRDRKHTQKSKLMKIYTKETMQNKIIKIPPMGGTPTNALLDGVRNSMATNNNKEHNSTQVTPTKNYRA